MKVLDINGIQLRWLGHSSFKLTFDDKIMYIDPYEVNDHEKATIILISHGHYDHCSIADLKKLTKSDTVIVTTPDTTSKFSGNIEGGDMLLVTPGRSVNAKGIEVKAIPAYNIGKEFHPRDHEWVGYIFTIKGITFYFAGDTDVIPEMSNIKCDVAMLPVSGNYVMDPKEAAKAARTIMPKLVIPMHYGKIVGSKKDALEFEKLVTFTQVKVME